MNVLTPLAVANADILRAIADHPGAGNKALADAVGGRDLSNFGKTLKLLEATDLCARDASGMLFLTQNGQLALSAITRADGATGPVDMVELFHVQILPDSLNPRDDFDSDDANEDLAALAADIEAHGLLQNLLVRADDRPNGGWSLETNGVRLQPYRLISGERRFRAIGLLIRNGRWPEDRKISCKVVETDDLHHRLMALAENLQRRNLNPLEEAKAFQGLAFAGIPTAEIAERVSVTQRKVQLALQLLDLSDEDQDRLTLPKDDPEYLSRPAALRILRGTTATNEKTLAQLVISEDPADQEELVRRSRQGEANMAAEEAATRKAAIQLVPAELVILGELIDAAAKRGKDRPGYGKGVEIRLFPNVGADKAVEALIGYGFIGFSQHYPASAYVTMSGRDAWSRALGLADPKTQLQDAREAAVGPVELAALADGDYLTSWLNLPKPPPPPAPLPAAQRLVLMELMDRQLRYPAEGDRQGTEISIDRPEHAFKGFTHLAYPQGPSEYTGARAYVHLYGADKAVGLACTAKDWPKRLRELQEEVGGKAATKKLPAGQYLTPWLNGPFEADPDILAAIEKDRLAEEAAEVASAARVQAITALEREALVAPPAGLDETLQRLLQDSPLPWRWNGETSPALLDAAGERVPLFFGRQAEEFARLIVIAINASAGLATPSATEAADA